MADYVKQIMTIDGPKPVDYQSLANLPTIDSTIIDGSTNAVQSGAVYDAISNINTQLSKKLDASNGKAADSVLFGGKEPSHYVSQEDLQKFSEDLGLGDIESDVGSNASAIQSLGTILNNKLDKDAQAVDSAKLGGQTPSYYATAQATADAQATANNAMSSATSAGTTASEAKTAAAKAQTTANAAMPKASFVFNSSTATLDITL